jgi:hypothetical protein
MPSSEILNDNTRKVRESDDADRANGLPPPGTA